MGGWAAAAAELILVYGVIRGASWWWLAMLLVAGIELWPVITAQGQRRDAWLENTPGLIVALSIVLTVAVLPRLATQLVVLALYAAWLAWRQRTARSDARSLGNLLIVQGALFEAVFLSAAIWQMPSWLVLVLVWCGAYASVYSALRLRGDAGAGVMAATWGVIATEVAWVLQLWLVTYVMKGGYVLVPQPALILTAMAYVFGSILAASRQGTLSRSRLAEYLVIGMILIMIVVAEILWRHTS